MSPFGAVPAHPEPEKTVEEEKEAPEPIKSDDSENTPVKANEKSPASDHKSVEKPIDKLASKV